MKVLVVVPTRREGEALRRPHFVCGVGPDAPALLAARVAADRPALLIIAGFCGGLDPSLGAGSVILARDVAAPGESPLVPGHASLEAVRRALRESGLSLVRSRILTVGRPAGTRAEKRDLWNEHGAAGVDLETFTLARAAAAQGVPWVALRVVLDPAGQTLPSGLRHWNAATRDRDVALGALMRPWDWPAYLRLAWQLSDANRGLRRAVRLASRLSVFADEPLELVDLSA